jgi:hypothetical protein
MGESHRLCVIGCRLWDESDPCNKVIVGSWGESHRLCVIGWGFDLLDQLRDWLIRKAGWAWPYIVM